MSIRAIIIEGDREGAPERWGGTQVRDIIEQPDTPYGRGRLKRLVNDCISGCHDDIVVIKYEDTERPDLPGRDVTAEFITIEPPVAEEPFKACAKCPWDWMCEQKGECEGVDKDYNPRGLDEEEEDEEEVDG